MRAVFLSICLLFNLSVFGQSGQGKLDTSQKIYNYAEQMPEPGYDLPKYLSEHLQYPDSAYNLNIQGRVILKFIVNNDGSISDCNVLKGIGAGCDEEAVRVIKSMPQWKAGIHNGVPVRVWFTMPVSFILTGKQRVYNYVDQMPVIGYDYNKYIAENLQYPDSARKNNIQGRVFVRFVVNEDGKVSDAMLLSNVKGGCNKEAIRLIESMPPWLPGRTKNGKPVRVWFNLPVQFALKHDSVAIRKINDTAQSSKMTYVEEMPIPPFDMNIYLRNNLHYPDSARDNDITGRVVVNFVVNENGSISNCGIKRSVCRVLDDEALRVVKNMPSWIPGMQQGKPVKVYFTQPISFNLEINGQQYISKKKKNKPTNYIYQMSYDHPDEWPKAGYDYVKYIADHVQYPDAARQNNIQGDVIVEFVVNKDSSISDCEIKKHLNGVCDTEALRVVKGMPNWNPGTFNNKAINAEELITVSFYPSEEEKQLAESKKIYTYVEQMPNSTYDYNDYIAKHLIYPDSAKRKNIFGRVIVKFIVTETGAIEDVSVLRGIGGGCDEEAVKVVKNMPPWKPGKQNGKPVKVYFNIPGSFVKTFTKNEIISSEKNRKAAIPKREYDFLKYMEDSLHYPELAKKNNIEGDVIIKFGVDEDGIISNCSVQQGIGYGCDEEALRLVKNMPPWTPGVKDGRPTVVYFTQSISFDLGGNTKSKKARKKNKEQ